ncbi:MAG: exonuclease domain-containing protein [bacterium]
MEELEKPLLDINYTIIDFETTGSLPSYDRIIEVGAISFRNGEIVDSFSTFVYPDREIPPFITYLTGITFDMVKDAPPPSLIMPKLMDFLKDSIFVAHNAKFDLSFLNSELDRLAMPPFEGEVLCTLNLARRLLKLPRRGLDSLAEYFGIEIYKRHRAIYDAEVTALILKRLLNLLAKDGIFTWGDLQKKIYGAYSIPENFLKLKSITKMTPRAPGIVIFLDEDSNVLYLTKSNDLKAKISSYFFFQEFISETKKQLLSRTVSLQYIATSTLLEAKMLEQELLSILSPQFNKRPYKRLRVTS